LGNKVTATVNLIIRDRNLLTLYAECIAMMMNQTSLSPDQYFYFCWESGPNTSPETFLFFKWRFSWFLSVPPRKCRDVAGN